MTDNNYTPDQIKTMQLEVTAELLHSLDLASQAITKLSDTVIYLNFENQDMIQRYYTALLNTQEGFSGLVSGFSSLASSYGIEVEDQL